MILFHWPAAAYRVAVTVVCVLGWGGGIMSVAFAALIDGIGVGVAMLTGVPSAAAAADCTSVRATPCLVSK